MSTLNTLRQLHSIIGDALLKIETDFDGKSLDWPSLDDPHVHGPAEAAASAPDSVGAANLIVAAAEQLTATVRAPALTLIDASMVYHLPACLRFVEHTHIVEFLREAGPQGLHITDIAAKSNQNTLKLGHAMRVLATYHIFREVQPNVFTNNRVSSIMDTGKSPAEIMADPDAKYDGTLGVAAFVATTGDELFKAAAYMTENNTDPETKHSLLPEKTAFQRAMKTDKLYFLWLEENNHVKRFSVAMMASSLWEAPDAILQGFPWAALPNGSLMVDVGGGIGSLALKVAKAHPHIRIIVQDRPIGEGLWKAELPDAITSGRVQLQGRTPDPCNDASVFVLRTITHNWSDAFVVKILKHLRDAALPRTQLVLGDHIIPYACPDDTDASLLPGAVKTLAPVPLLANLGRASAISYWVDMTMQTVFNGQDRTLSEIASVLTEARWRVTNVHRIADSRYGYITAEIM